MAWHRRQGPAACIRSIVRTPFLFPLGLKKVAGSNPAPATMKNEGLADAAAANPFVYPDFSQEVADCVASGTNRRLRMTCLASLGFLRVKWQADLDAFRFVRGTSALDTTYSKTHRALESSQAAVCVPSAVSP